MGDQSLYIDAKIILTKQKGTTVTKESLFPARQEITLPLNGLNIFFSDCTTVINHNTKLDSDR